MLLNYCGFPFVNSLTLRIRILTMLGIFGVATMVDAQSLPAAGQASVMTVVRPPETGVLLLPALDATRDSANMQAPRQAVIRHRQQAEFITRQFKMLGETMALKAAEDSPALDLATLATRTAENMDLLGKRAGADWVVHTVVEDVDANAGPEGGFLITTRLLVQIRDIRRHDWLLNQRYTGEATGGGAPIMTFLRSLDNATKGALAGALGAYPAIVTVQGEDGLVDYLAGQTIPVVGEPGKPFQAPPVPTQ